jgi:hypothetical protein
VAGGICRHTARRSFADRVVGLPGVQDGARDGRFASRRRGFWFDDILLVSRPEALTRSFYRLNLATASGDGPTSTSRLQVVATIRSIKPGQAGLFALL